ncbi:MAG: hypothetical protein Tsb002_17710 [Wenzhouxiangellaceae bacterium]
MGMGREQSGNLCPQDVWVWGESRSGSLYMLIKVTRPMAVSINKEDSLFQGRKMIGLKVYWHFPNIAENHG